MEQLCPISLETLLDYHESRLSAAMQHEVAVHLATICLSCQARLEWIRTVEPLLSESLRPVMTPSPQAKANALRLARLLPSPIQPAGWKRFIAQLRLEENVSFVPMGARGDTSLSLQQIYTTATHVITLWDEAESPQHHYLIGQVYERSGQLLFPSSVVLLSPGSEDRDAIQEGSEFHLSDVAPGRYAIRCELDAADIILPDVEVGSP
jgi:hypothetical protein